MRLKSVLTNLYNKDKNFQRKRLTGKMKEDMGSYISKIYFSVTSQCSKTLLARSELDCIDSLCSLVDMCVCVCMCECLCVWVCVFVCEAFMLMICSDCLGSSFIGQACGHAATTQFVSLTDVTH